MISFSHCQSNLHFLIFRKKFFANVVRRFFPDIAQKYFPNEVRKFFQNLVSLIAPKVAEQMWKFFPNFLNGEFRP